jgi:hypothetical protein
MPSSERAAQYVTPGPALSETERERLAGLLACMPEGRRWAVMHMHAPLLCALGLLGVPDSAYARAVQRRFNDPADVRRRALALVEELGRDARDERYALRRRDRRSPLRSMVSRRPATGEDPATAEERVEDARGRVSPA